MYYLEGYGEVHHQCPFFFHGLGVTSGDFDVKVIVTDDSNQHVACYRFLYTMTRAWINMKVWSWVAYNSVHLF